MGLWFYSVDTIEVTGKVSIYSPESTVLKRYYCFPSQCRKNISCCYFNSKYVFVFRIYNNYKLILTLNVGNKSVYSDFLALQVNFFRPRFY